MQPHFEQVHAAASCCRSTPARPSEVQIFKTRNGFAPRPDGCQALCAARKQCRYFSHSTDFENCILCSSCNNWVIRRGFGFRYTSWKRVSAPLHNQGAGLVRAHMCPTADVPAGPTKARTGVHLRTPSALMVEPSWAAWSHYPTTHKHPSWPTHFHELPADAYSEWTPERTRRAPAKICVVSMLSSDLLKPTEWGAFTAEVNVNWALAHGYKFAMFRQRLTNMSLAYTWSKPRAVLFALEQGEGECAWVFQLDGDAVVNRLNHTVEALITQLKMGGDNAAQLALTCHSNLGRGDNCQACRCLRASERCRPGDVEREFKRSISSGTCIPNTGGYLVRNSEVSRAMFRWWAGGGEGRCHWRARPHHPVAMQFPEQYCSQWLKARWPHLVDIVNNRVMNTHSWFDPTTRRGPAVFPVWNLQNLTGCMRSDSFICHAWGMTDWWCRHSRLCVLTTRRDIFSQHLASRRQRLKSLLAVRGEQYLPFTSHCATRQQGRA